MEKLKEYIHNEETTDTLISIIIYDKNTNDIIKYFEDQLEKAKKITNIIKKNKINTRLFNFIKYINDNYEENSIVNSIFLIDDKIHYYELKKMN